MELAEEKEAHGVRLCALARAGNRLLRWPRQRAGFSPSRWPAPWPHLGLLRYARAIGLPSWVSPSKAILGLIWYVWRATRDEDETLVQTCIVHLIRNSVAFVSWKDRKAIMPSLKAIYRAEAADIALTRLEEFEAEWGRRYPAIGPIWRRAWEHVVPFFGFAPSIRKMIYTTNCVEALNRSLRLR